MAKYYLLSATTYLMKNANKKSPLDTEYYSRVLEYDLSRKDKYFTTEMLCDIENNINLHLDKLDKFEEVFLTNQHPRDPEDLEIWNNHFAKQHLCKFCKIFERFEVLSNRKNDNIRARVSRFIYK